MRDYIQIAVTGGVACGKTTVCRRLIAHLPSGITAFVSCDEEVRLLLQNREIQEQIGALARDHGRELLVSDGIERATLRELLFENSDFRGKVERVLHPLVLDRVIAQSETWSDLVRISIVEVPLLYEVDFPLDRDLDVVVASSRSTQRERLIRDRGLEEGGAERIIEAQMSIEEKMQRANLVIWNEGAIETLLAQSDHLASRCDKLFN